MTPGELAAIRDRLKRVQDGAAILEVASVYGWWADASALCNECERLTAENARLTEALREIVIGKVSDDYAAGADRADTLMAARLCAVARAALADTETGV